MPLPTKSTRPASDGGKDADDSSTFSNNLWVGNLAPDVTDSNLMDLFAQYGALDSVTCYSARSYAFVYFKRVEDAKAAKIALQGSPLRGLLLKIEFARPVRSHLCALLFFTFSSDSCIIINHHSYSSCFPLTPQLFLFLVHSKISLPSKLLGMHSRCSNQIPSFSIFRNLLN